MRDGGGRAETIAQGTFSPPLGHHDHTVFLFIPHNTTRFQRFDSVFFLRDFFCYYLKISCTFPLFAFFGGEDQYFTAVVRLTLPPVSKEQGEPFLCKWLIISLLKRCRSFLLVCLSGGEMPFVIKIIVNSSVYIDKIFINEAFKLLKCSFSSPEGQMRILTSIIKTAACFLKIFYVNIPECCFI